jgi:hypothetical protein
MSPTKPDEPKFSRKKTVSPQKNENVVEDIKKGEQKS